MSCRDSELARCLGEFYLDAPGRRPEIHSRSLRIRKISVFRRAPMSAGVREGATRPNSELKS